MNLRKFTESNFFPLKLPDELITWALPFDTSMIWAVRLIVLHPQATKHSSQPSFGRDAALHAQPCRWVGHTCSMEGKHFNTGYHPRPSGILASVLNPPFDSSYSRSKIFSHPYAYAIYPANAPPDPEQSLSNVAN